MRRFAIVLALVAANGYAQQRVTLFNSPAPISLDGHLQEPAWQKAQVISDFRQRDPKEGEPATEKTEVRVVLYEKALYIGVVAWDSNPNLIVAREMRRDGAVEADDSITIVLDTYLDHRNAFYFAFNSLGARRDGLIVDEGTQASAKSGSPASGDPNLNADWNGIWDVKTAVTETGWQATVMIPLDTLRFSSKQRNWGINVRRTITRKNEEVLWQGYRRNDGVFRVSQAGLLDGLPEFKQAYRFEIRPYVAFAVTETLPPAGSPPTADMIRKHPVDVGADGKIKISEKLVADLTVNTDFAQTEADQAVVNLTRFPVLFPEKRDFFLENAGVFDFVSAGNNRIFFSRRIGLSDKGEPIPIDYGGRVTGKIGAFDVGFLNIRTRAEGEVPATDYTTIRPKYPFWRKSYVGAIFTNIYNARDGNRNQAYGLDSVISTSNFFGQNLLINSSIVQTSTRGLKGDNTSGYVGLVLPNDWEEAWLTYGFLQKNFNPELGFLRRGAVDQIAGKWRFQPRPPAPWNRWIRKVYFKPLELEIFRTLPGRVMESLTQEFRPIGVDFQSGDTVEWNIVREFDRLDEEFKIFKDVVIPKGRYWWTSYELTYKTATKRRWSVKGGTNWGHYYSGEMKGISAEANFKVTSQFSLSGSYATNRARYQGESFTTHEMTSRMVYAFSNRINVQVFSQWNNDSNAASFYVRLHIIPKIGSDVYGVLNQIMDTSGLRRRNLGRALRGKAIPGFQF